MNAPTPLSPLSAAVAGAYAPDVYDFDSEEVVDRADVQIKNALGANTGLVITVASPVHPDRKRWEYALMNRKRAAIQQNNRLINSSAEEDHDVETERLAVFTLGWNSAKTPFSREAALAIYGDPRRAHIRAQVKAAVDTLELFTRSSAPR